MTPADHFPSSYRASRERLLGAVRALASRHDVTIDSRALAERGPERETLALDFVLIGARHPRHAFVVSSGTHGVEGFTGAAVQHYLLAEVLPNLDIGPETAIVVQHANNPYGFAWLRRVNESNVDCNRNFRDTFERDQVSPDYEALYDALNPADLNPDNEALRWASIDRFVAENGMRRFQTAVAEGQYRHPQGLQFGGHRQEASTRALLALAREHLGAAQDVIWLDFHTGLGESGACELITGAPAGSDSHRAAQHVWGEGVKSAASGESISTPLNGLLDRGIERALADGTRLAFAYPEYGTHPLPRVLKAMRADNWLHAHGRPTDLSDPLTRAIKAEMLEAFRPDSAAWRAQVVSHAAGLVESALRHLPGVRRLDA